MLYNDNHNTMYYNVIRDYCMWPLSVLSKLMNPSEHITSWLKVAINGHCLLYVK